MANCYTNQEPWKPNVCEHIVEAVEDLPLASVASYDKIYVLPDNTAYILNFYHTEFIRIDR